MRQILAKDFLVLHKNMNCAFLLMLYKINILKRAGMTYNVTLVIYQKASVVEVTALTFPKLTEKAILSIIGINSCLWTSCQFDALAFYCFLYN